MYKFYTLLCPDKSGPTTSTIGAFLDGYAKPGSLVALYPGAVVCLLATFLNLPVFILTNHIFLHKCSSFDGSILIPALPNVPQYTPLTAHHMPNFPHIDKDNSYLMVRFANAVSMCAYSWRVSLVSRKQFAGGFASCA